MIAPARMASASPRRLTDRVPGRRQIARHVSQVVLMSWPIAQRYAVKSRHQRSAIGSGVQYDGAALFSPCATPARWAYSRLRLLALLFSRPFSDRLWRLPRRIAVIQDHPFERPSRRRHPRYDGISTCKGTAMPLTMSPQRFEEIRQKVIDHHLVRKATEALQQMEQAPQQGFATIDLLMQHLDSLAAGSTCHCTRRPSRKT